VLTTPSAAVFSTGSAQTYTASPATGALSIASPAPSLITSSNISKTAQEIQPHRLQFITTCTAAAMLNLVALFTVGGEAVGSYTITLTCCCLSTGEEVNYTITYSDWSAEYFQQFVPSSLLPQQHL
jgi:hypothetical protein